MSKRILIVEDNAGLVVNLFSYLEPRGYVLDVARNGTAGLDMAMSGTYDAIVLDWMLPKLDGVALLGRLREAGATVPVVLLTARDQIDDKVHGFRSGADDYLTKPFALAELEVRLESLMQRRQARRPVLQVGDLRFDTAARVAHRGDINLQLYPVIATLLEALMRASPTVVPRQRLESLVWGENTPDRDLLRAHVYELRKRIDGPSPIKLIHTVPKLGYRMAAPESREP